MGVFCRSWWGATISRCHHFLGDAQTGCPGPSLEDGAAGKINSGYQGEIKRWWKKYWGKLEEAIKINGWVSFRCSSKVAVGFVQWNGFSTQCLQTTWRVQRAKSFLNDDFSFFNREFWSGNHIPFGCRFWWCDFWCEKWVLGYKVPCCIELLDCALVSKNETLQDWNYCVYVVTT